MNTITPPPTPETDALAVVCYGEGGIEASHGFRAVPIKDCRKLERERDEAREQIEAMREAIREAGHILGYYRKFTPALVDLPEDIWLETVEGKQVLSALTKLQPFIAPWTPPDHL